MIWWSSSSPTMAAAPGTRPPRPARPWPRPPPCPPTGTRTSTPWRRPRLRGTREGPSSYFMKSPPVQSPDDTEYDLVEQFITDYGPRAGDAPAETGPALAPPAAVPTNGHKDEHTVAATQAEG